MKEAEKNKRGWNYDPRRHFDIRELYKTQLKKFRKLGIGKYTEFGVKVTEDLISITEKRYKEICEQTFRYCKKYDEAISETLVDDYLDIDAVIGGFNEKSKA